MASGDGRPRAIRIRPADGPPPAEAIVARAQELGVLGWVRVADGRVVELHAEGHGDGLDALVAFVGEGAEAERFKVEGHEQFAIRGVPAGAFLVSEHQATAHHFDLRLEVDGVMRSWAVPKGPSLDPAVKRFAVQVPDHAMTDDPFEGRSGRGGAIVWDRGPYEQGGRVPWPEALERGHAVFVLHGEKLRGGFALQRTSSRPPRALAPGDKPQWLLIKRRDEHARPGSEIAVERPQSVRSGRTLAELLDEG